MSRYKMPLRKNYVLLLIYIKRMYLLYLYHEINRDSNLLHQINEYCFNLNTNIFSKTIH